MRELKHVLFIYFTALCAANFQGCAHIDAYAQPADCRSCHVSYLAVGARDLSSYYTKASTHHPVGIQYPATDITAPNFLQPNARVSGIAFFDRNGNRQPESNEVQLFGKIGVEKIECASCHLPHGDNAVAILPTPDFYLRVENDNSALCLTCHNK